MKTNQIMKRPMGEFVVEQRTKDTFFNATELLKAWNDAVDKGIIEGAENPKRKEMKEYLSNKSTKEFLKALAKEENLHGDNSPYVVSKARSDRGGGTWMHPLMFIDFAMWLNPAFKVKVLKFVSDQMLYYRNEAGDAYKVLSSAVAKIVPENKMRKSMPNVAKALNWIVFNEHEHQVRNEYGVEEKQRELFSLERQVAMLINDGFIRNYEYLMNYLRRKFCERWRPELLG